MKYRRHYLTQCPLCNKGAIISRSIGYCIDCIRERFDEVWPSIERVHRESRRRFGLPEIVPKDPEGIECKICVNECKVREGERGYCGVRINKGGKFKGGLPEEGNLYWYYDPLPTNCVADWVCPGGTGRGYPKYCYRKGPEYGCKNLSVFYHACSFTVSTVRTGIIGKRPLHIDLSQQKNWPYK